jgi:hypothetical protein
MTTPPPAEDPFVKQIMDLAATYKLEGEEKSAFIHAHLTKAGYKVINTYEAPKPETDPKNPAGKSGGGWFAG